jgi:hypothetical protein
MGPFGVCYSIPDPSIKNQTRALPGTAALAHANSHSQSILKLFRH